MKKNIQKMTKGKKVIGSGSSRVVYNWNNTQVLKVAKSKLGIRCNRTEVIIYNSVPSRVKKYLAAVIRHGTGYRWLIMRKYSRKFPKSRRIESNVIDLRNKFESYGIIPHDTRVYKFGHYQNLRLNRKGKIVVIDYGHFIKNL
ncbi:hypothetical protein ACFQZT_28915 [Paenibacillus sp. GCM10027628]|uniref:hypothetical protein n=1 Tax=Paenibacillus sp. GCM10027628 TaxID=3273413 RepID=UPI00362890C9